MTIKKALSNANETLQKTSLKKLIYDPKYFLAI